MAIHDHVGKIMARLAVEIAATGDETDDRFLGVAPDLPHGEFALRSLLLGVNSECGHVPIVAVDEDLITRLQVPEVIEDVRTGLRVNMTHDDRWAACPRSRTLVVPTHQTEWRHFHVAVL
jgi:hypothetical protein